MWKRSTKAIKGLKKVLTQTPALNLPDFEKPLLIKMMTGVSLGVLTQALGLTKRPIGCFLKELDTVAQAWANVSG